MLHYGQFDASLGTDQGGSVRVPASWCGVIGLKPTQGLIPYTGVAPMESSLDHVGILTTSVDTLSRVLSVLAGPDGFDMRQHAVPPALDTRYSNLEMDESEWHLTVLDSSISRSCGEVRSAFAEALDRLSATGIRLTRSGLDPAQYGPVSTGLFVEGSLQTIRGTHSTFGGTDFEWPEFTHALMRGIRTAWNLLSPTFKATIQAASVMDRAQASEYYSRAQVARKRLKQAYASMFEFTDLIVEPTVPVLPFRLQEYAVSMDEVLKRGWSPLANTGIANVTGFPSISLPLAHHNGLPVGVMVTAPPWCEKRLLDFARYCERRLGWYSDAPHSFRSS